MNPAAINSILPKQQGIKNNDTLKLAENLNRLMTKKNVTLTQAARAIGMNKSTLHNFRNGVIPRNILIIKKLADFFEVNLIELLFGPEVNSDLTFRSNSLGDTYEVVIRPIIRK